MRPIEKVEKNKILVPVDKTALKCRYCRVHQVIDDERSIFCCEYVKGSFFNESCVADDEEKCRYVIGQSSDIKRDMIGAIRRR